jgi:hypothetical protein
MKNGFIIAVAFILLYAFEQAKAHDIHISYCQAEVKGNDLHVRVSYYKDDFTMAVKHWYKGKADNFSSQEFQAAEFEYVKNYFRVWEDPGFKQQVMPSPMKITDDGTSIIFELEFSYNSTKFLIVDQRVLFKEYNDQMNIFFVKAFGKEINHIFTPSKPTLVLKP